MGKPFTRFLCILLLLAPLMGSSSAQPQDMPTPPAPLALPDGESVQLAWSLPPAPRADTVVIYRSTRRGAQFDEVARLPAADMRYVDKGVVLGQTYQYRVQTVRGVNASPLSEAAEVLVGGGSRIIFLGGSLERGLFEVVAFRRGRRVSARFVHKPGDPMGDLAYMADVDAVEDFRLGPRLVKLRIGHAESRKSGSEVLKNASGEAVKDLSGREVTLDFDFPGAAREVVIATIALADGREVELKEGEVWRGN